MPDSERSYDLLSAPWVGEHPTVDDLPTRDLRARCIEAVEDFDRRTPRPILQEEIVDIVLGIVRNA